MGTLGKLIHVSADLVLFSAFLAGVRRNTGLSPKLDMIENRELKGLGERYLNVGEWFMDTSCGVLGGSQYFERK